MKKMKKEQIEQAATDTCIFERNIYNDEYQPYYMDGFKDGAEWRISSVWHDMTEIPEYNRECLIYSSSKSRLGWHAGKFMKRSDGNKWDVFGYFTPAEREEITRWAYIDDLIPEKEDR